MIIFYDFHGTLAGWLAARQASEPTVTELMGLLGLLEGVFGSLALLEGGLKHKVLHALADFQDPGKPPNHELPNFTNRLAGVTEFVW